MKRKTKSCMTLLWQYTNIAKSIQNLVRKKGTVCRFNFPRPPSTRTFISEPSDPEKDSEEEEEFAKEMLSNLWKVIKENEDKDLDVSEIFKKAGLTQESFEKCYCFITNRNTAVLKRQPNEIYTNQYNPHLLRAWDANMDIQYILDALSCVVYIISYISKAERELGLLLLQTKNEAEKGNVNAQQTLKTIGTSYLHHREISAQEAVFRVTGRPYIDTFIKICLARFCSEYSVILESQLPQQINKETTFKLDGSLGYIRKRTRTSPAVIKYPRFSSENSPEKYYQSILQLYLPYRYDEQLKPPLFQTYENFFTCGKVTSVIEEDLSIPDLNNEKISSVGTNLLSVSLTKNEIIPRLRSLNVKQRRILYKVRDWCVQKSNGKTPEPLHLFISGGAGTGKSHLIKCIQYEATRILAKTSENPDDLTVLLTAPTGTAAFNIH
ncbi:Hypothetical predicted protein [Mytilus galloprovincialis]|uniref:DNA helicase n=1 Tax=Mytilus galloprovincialis TaxID=29158 RepID=A0A8B6BQX3_MYTGA|nr:Hypothetical predicted protein [Mytilus galloprovincialis]